MLKHGGKKGFTLVELSLAVGFIALLALTVALIINDTVATYRRGLTLNNINTTGMDLVDDIRAAVQNAPSRTATYECESVYTGTANGASLNECKDDQARKFIMLQRTATVNMRDGESAEIPVYGAICTGSYSYIWNSGYFFGENAGKVVDAQPATLKYTYNGETTTVGGEDQRFRLLKVKDDRRAVCKSVLRDASGAQYISYNNNNVLSGNFDITNPSASVTNPITYYEGGLTEQPEIVMKDESTNTLSLYDLTISPPAADSSNSAAFYAVSFILGTLQGGLNVTAAGNFCKTPTDYDEDFDYCAINKFNFAAQATGG